jgi:methionine synthase II (cobalamin-independent)
MTFTPHFWTTHVGSVPQLAGQALIQQRLFRLDIPAWPQLPRRDFRESMYVQYSAVLPGAVLDPSKEKIVFDTQQDLSLPLETFYAHYLADDLDYFAMPESYATGFYSMLEALKSSQSPRQDGWIKGQVTGPISFGLTATDQDLRPIFYNEVLADAIVKNMAMVARWQVRQLNTWRQNVVIFVDEPYLASFGSAFISLSREQAISVLDEVFTAIQGEGAYAGVHCCANTDWSMLLATKVNILNLDAYGYLENLALYPSELRGYLDRGGVIAWGIVPNNETIYRETPQSLAVRLLKGLEWISAKAEARGVKIQPGELADRSLVVPSCGLGSTSVEIAERVLDVLVETGQILQG